VTTFQERVVGALKLRSETFKEVQQDVTATGQAAAVVLLASLANGIGVYWLLGAAGIIRGAIVSLVAWLVAALVLWLLGTKVIPGKNTKVDMGQLLRTVGFAQSPGLLRIAGVIPGLSTLAWEVAGIWTFIATVMAMRVALYYDDYLRLTLVCILAAVMYYVTIGFVVGGLYFWS
jgi:hypothetical protein